MPVLAVHPRVCGEQSITGSPPSRGRGSSPRVRGTGDTIRTVRTVRRFIPACAGNRAGQAGRRVIMAVHPRVCGEQCSGPCMLVIVVRFIPACAGNSQAAQQGNRHLAVHPRVCGEQLPCHWYCSYGGGSSPRVRGTGFGDHFIPHVTRFIPACAGNRVNSHRRFSCRSVHPRVCGEQWMDTDMP